MLFYMAFILTLAQDIPTAAEKAERCLVVLDDMGRVGLRISDAQQLATSTTDGIGKRIGHDGIIYEGQLTQAKSMKRRLGRGTDTTNLDDKIHGLKTAIGNSKHRIRIRFKKRKGMHLITMSCRVNGKKPKDVLHKKVLKAKRFDEAREQMIEALKTFCPEIIAAKPVQKIDREASKVSKERSKRLQTWKPPPVRK